MYVDNYFVKDKQRSSNSTSSSSSSSQVLAVMTSSLRGDSSSGYQHGRNGASTPKSSRSRDQMEDSGFESSTVQLSGSSNLTIDAIDWACRKDGQRFEKSSSDSAIGDKIICDGIGTVLQPSTTYNDRSSHIDRSQHESLASMEDRVNMLIREGESLERQRQIDEREGSVSSEVERQCKLSITASSLKKLVTSASSTPQRKQSSDLDNGIATLHNSGSNSSITILAAVESDCMAVAQASSLCTTPVHFMIGSLENSSHTLDHHQALSSCNNDASVQPDVMRVSSPLSSNICNSMVSSVYETSIASISGNNSGGSGSGLSDKSGGEATEVLILASGESVETSSQGHPNKKADEEEEEMPSIYDQPSNLNSGSVKSKHKNKKDKMKKSRKKKSSRDQEYDAEKSAAAYADLIDRISMTGESRQSKSSASSCEDLEPVTVARSCEENDDESSIGQDTDVDFSSKTTFRFDHLNHRLTLYMMMSLFGNNEEFTCKIKVS